MSPYWIPVGSDLVEIGEKEMSFPRVDIGSLHNYDAAYLILQQMTDEELIAEAQKRGLIDIPQDVVNEDAINLTDIEAML